MAPDLDELRTAVDTGSPAVAAEAALLLGKVVAALEPLDAAYAEAPRLLDWARRSGTPARSVLWATAYPAWELARRVLLAHLRDARPQDLVVPAAVADLAETGFGLQPELPLCRHALAAARLLQDRYTDVRALYAGVPLPENGVTADGHAIRALAEVRLGDVESARRLVASARRLKADSVWIRLAVLHVERASGPSPDA